MPLGERLGGSVALPKRGYPMVESFRNGMTR